MKKRSHATPLPATNTGASISKQTFIFSMIVVASIAFIVGTRSDGAMANLGNALGFKVPHGEIDLSSVEKTYQQLNANFDGKLNKSSLIEGANRGLVEAAGDKHTMYLSSKEAEEFNDALSGEIGGGVGIELTYRYEMPVVARVLPDNPAGRAGLQKDDIILAVNGNSTADWSLEQTAAKIRGKVGTTVKLQVQRDEEQREFSVTRAEINNPSVTSEIKDGIGVLSITRFDDNTGEQARRAVEKFKDNKVRGVVVDLRDNGGGYVTAAQSVAGLWFDNKTVVTERVKGKVTETLRSDGKPLLENTPTVVLINGNSASASEIVAGSLRDYKKATLIGEKTYGKGTMQQMIDLPGGSVLKVTIAHWFTPSGHSLDNNGLKPDIKVELTKDDHQAGKDPQMAAAIKYLKN